MELSEFNKYVKEARVRQILKVDDLVERAFSNSRYHNKDCGYFRENASAILLDLRRDTWKLFQENEKKFTEDVMLSITPDAFKKMNGEEAIRRYVVEFSDHIYSLQLSNTQSRRTRAGKEFELILELILKHSGVKCQAQGEIGKDFYTQNGLGELVDLVIPSANAYTKNKRNTILLSSKTILRERWQEVTDEVKRTGAREIFLATIDEDVSDSTLNIMEQENLVLVVPRNIQKEKYSSASNVISLEEFIKIALDACKKF